MSFFIKSSHYDRESCSSDTLNNISDQKNHNHNHNSLRMHLLKKSPFAKTSSPKDTQPEDLATTNVKEKRVLERPSPPPSTFPSRSRRRIPLSMTAAYSWLGVQGTTEQFPTAAELNFKTLFANDRSVSKKRMKLLSESDVRQVPGPENELPPKAAAASLMSGSPKLSVVIPEGCVPKAGILITVTSPSGATSAGFCDMEEKGYVRPKRLLDERVNK